MSVSINKWAIELVQECEVPTKFFPKNPKKIFVNYQKWKRIRTEVVMKEACMKTDWLTCWIFEMFWGNMNCQRLACAEGEKMSLTLMRRRGSCPKICLLLVTEVGPPFLLRPLRGVTCGKEKAGDAVLWSEMTLSVRFRLYGKVLPVRSSVEGRLELYERDGEVRGLPSQWNKIDNLDSLYGELLLWVPKGYQKGDLSKVWPFRWPCI